MWLYVPDDMATHMKTTVEISEPLLRAAKELAHQESITLRELIEEGLQRVVSERKQRRRFKLVDRSFKGEGVQPGVEEGSWDQIRSMIYEGRGG